MIRVCFRTIRLTTLRCTFTVGDSNNLDIHARRDRPWHRRSGQCVSGILFTSGVSERGMKYHDVTFVLQVDYFLTRTLAHLIKFASGRSRKLEHEAYFFTALGQQRGDLVCSLLPTIAYLTMSLPSLFGALPRLRKHTPFRDCGGYTRWRQQLDGCRGTRAALSRVECPGQG